MLIRTYIHVHTHTHTWICMFTCVCLFKNKQQEHLSNLNAKNCMRTSYSLLLLRFLANVSPDILCQWLWSFVRFRVSSEAVAFARWNNKKNSIKTKSKGSGEWINAFGNCDCYHQGVWLTPSSFNSCWRIRNKCQRNRKTTVPVGQLVITKVWQMSIA